MRLARDGGEGHRFDGRVAHRTDILSSQASGEFLGAVEPVAGERLAIE
jgi:hypothetical protein